MCGVFAFAFDLVTFMPFRIAWENFGVYANVVCAPGCLPVAGIYSGKQNASNEKRNEQQQQQQQQRQQQPNRN